MMDISERQIIVWFQNRRREQNMKNSAKSLIHRRDNKLELPAERKIAPPQVYLESNWRHMEETPQLLLPEVTLGVSQNLANFNMPRMQGTQIPQFLPQQSAPEENQIFRSNYEATDRNFVNMDFSQELQQTRSEVISQDNQIEHVVLTEDEQSYVDAFDLFDTKTVDEEKNAYPLTCACQISLCRKIANSKIACCH